MEEFRNGQGQFVKGIINPFVSNLELGRKPRLTDEFKKARGWFYVGKEKYYWRNCNFCGKEYKGQGKSFCSKSCMRLAEPIIMKGENSPAKRPEVRLKMSKSWKPRILSEEAKKRIREPRPCMQGENHPRWIKDRSKLKKDQKRNDSAYQDWRMKVYKRDNFKCKIGNCNCNGRIEAHHILSWSNNKDSRYEINNGIVLCHLHHGWIKGKEDLLIDNFKQLVLESNK